MSKVINYEHILIAFSGNFVSGDGDVLDSAGTLTFDQPKITGQDQRPAGFGCGCGTISVPPQRNQKNVNGSF